MINLKIVVDDNLDQILDILYSVGYKKQAWFSDTPKYLLALSNGSISSFDHEPTLHNLETSDLTMLKSLKEATNGFRATILV